ncbi:helix-turn-helix domain-containing protein [Desertivirga xinjiangensis]|uniref:helix-turn-helix domain-containing protein n=1 Tax=Desertivirga xinjiangensis TaxID=539206 RepID=UPI00210E172B|nr:helix-turn-helix transcriptional regulator [Pedobacter xinjiangensis]
MIKKDIPVYTIDKLSQSNQKDIQVSRFAPYLAVHKNLHLAHRHSFYHLILFIEGGGTHEIDFETFPVKPFQIYFMIPGQVHSWSFENFVDGYVVNFSEQFFQSFLSKPDYLEQFPFFNGIISESVIELPVDIQPQIQYYFEELIRESESGSPYTLDMVRSILIQLFISVSRLTYDEQRQRATNHNYKLLRNFQKLIEENYFNLRLPKDYAELLYISPNHLNSLCRDLIGLQAGDVIRNRIVLEAKRLLVNLDLTVAEIAYKLNFDDNSYFTKFFKKQAGLTPDEFRKEAVKQTQKKVWLK